MCLLLLFKLRRMGALWLLSDNSNIWNLVPSFRWLMLMSFWNPVNLECLLFTMYSSCPLQKCLCVSLRPNIKLPLSRESELSSGRPLWTLLIWVKFFFKAFLLESTSLSNGNAGVKSLWWLGLCLHLSKIRFWVCFKVVLSLVSFFPPVLLT